MKRHLAVLTALLAMSVVTIASAHEPESARLVTGIEAVPQRLMTLRLELKKSDGTYTPFDQPAYLYMQVMTESGPGSLLLVPVPADIPLYAARYAEKTLITRDQKRIRISDASLIDMNRGEDGLAWLTIVVSRFVLDAQNIEDGSEWHNAESILLLTRSESMRTTPDGLTQLLSGGDEKYLGAVAVDREGRFLGFVGSTNPWNGRVTFSLGLVTPAYVEEGFDAFRQMYERHRGDGQDQEPHGTPLPAYQQEIQLRKI